MPKYNMSQRHPVTYQDAVALLTGSDSKLPEMVDKALGLGIVASALLLGPASLTLVGPKNELIKVGRKGLEQLGPSLKGMRLADRISRVHAAHTVLVMTSFLEACEEVLSKPDYTSLELSEKELSRVFSQETEVPDSDAKARLREQLGNGVIPAPSAFETAEDRYERLRLYFNECANRLREFLQGLEAWHSIERRMGQHSSDELSNTIASAAAARYKSHCQKLAGEVQEFLYWSLNEEILATRARVQETVAARADQLENSLSGIQRLLANITKEIPQSPTLRWQKSLQAANTSELAKQLVDAREGDLNGFITPTVERGYVNPNFRAVPYDSLSQPALEWWWSRHNVQKDLSTFLSMHLTSPNATNYPTLVLGHPGIGKSMLSRVLAARLPTDGFITIRVTLRSVAANAAIEAQIEEALFSTIHERVSWPQIVEGSPNLLPVVILDGFDELLQATGSSQSDYLERVQRFMEGEYNQGRPVAVFVTSRTTVVDHARIQPGTMMVKIEEFSEDQITEWLSVWNSANTGIYATSKVQPLTLERLNDFRELAAQPVLLLMLALYDGSENALIAHQGLNRAALYEGLLKKFVRREVMKSESHAVEAEVTRHIEIELYDLSLIALGMFNRGKLVLHQDELERDLSALGRDRQASGAHNAGFTAPLSSAERAFGRFFFVHSSEANDLHALSPTTHVGSPRPLGRAFEFLHATFGEFLVARLAARMFGALHFSAQSLNPWERPELLPDVPLFAALFSSQCFSKRLQIILFLREILADQKKDESKAVSKWLLMHSPDLHFNRDFLAYNPLPQSAISRTANLSANVVLILACITGAFRLSDLIEDEEQQNAKGWRKWSKLWESQFDDESWNGLNKALSLVDSHEKEPSFALREVGALTETSDDVLPELGMYDENGSSTAIYRPNQIENLEHAGALKLDWDAVRMAQMLRILQRDLGGVASNIYLYPPRSSHESPGTDIPGGHYGATYFVSLAYGDNDPDSIHDHLSTVLSIIEFGETGAGGRAAWQLLRQIEGLLPSIGAQQVMTILTALNSSYDDFDSVEIHFMRLKVLTKLWQLEGSQSMMRFDAVEMAESIWASLDPVHYVEVARERVAELLVSMLEAGMPIYRIAPEYSSFADWVDRMSIVGISKLDDRLAYRILCAIKHFGFLAWASSTSYILEYLDERTITRLDSRQAAYYVHAATTGHDRSARKAVGKFVNKWIMSGGSKRELEDALSGHLREP